MPKIKGSVNDNSTKRDGIERTTHRVTRRSANFSTKVTKATPIPIRSAKKRNLLLREENGSETEIETAKTAGRSLEDAIPIESVIVDRSFRIYKVSQLFGLVYERRFLKSMSRKLNFCMQKENKFGYDYISFGGNSMLQVDIAPLCDADENIVGIRIRVMKTEEYNDKSQEIFFGVMTSGGCSEIKNVRPGFVWLPLLLVKGSVEITDRITNFFTREFDCIVNIYEIPSVELCWFAAVWAGFNADIPRKALIMTYVNPDNVAGLDKLTLTMNSEDVYDLWTRVHDVESSEFVIGEMTAFIQSLEQHIIRYFAIDLQGLRLIQIQNTSILVNCSGKLKLFAHTTAVHILKHIASLVTKQIPF